MDITAFLSVPHLVLIDAGDGWQRATASANGHTHGVTGVEVRMVPSADALQIQVQAQQISRVRLRWQRPAPSGQILGDHWERGYGDLEWRGMVPERAMPWYVLIHDGTALHGLGVATGGGAMASWHVDAGGVVLDLDLRSGGLPSQPGPRWIEAATVRARRGRAEEDEHFAAHQFCRLLCPQPRLPQEPVYGGNDWYYAYSLNSAAAIRRDAERLASWAGEATVRPWCVIDAGWEQGAPIGTIGGADMQPTAAFDDMAALARDITKLGCKPGLWVRPLLDPGRRHPGCLVQRPGAQAMLDPSLEETLDEVRHRVSTVAAWGYGLIKHDFTTYDALGRWGFEMADGVAAPGWGFADRRRTTAEVLRHLYATIRAAAGDMLVLGCNTVGHLAAGLEELQRTGNDTSGKTWEKTRRMGVNTLAMRMPQHGAFFAADADCIGLTAAIPWHLNQAWLEAVAASGTALFVSAHPEAVGREQEAALRAAFALAASGPQPAAAMDWRTTTAPRTWRTAVGERQWRWDEDGALPVCGGN
jgi:alpha-galactosidase